MASSKVSRTLVKSLQGRSFAAAAAAQADRASLDSNPKCSVKKLSNGMHVGVIPSNSPVARVAVVAKAGSRYEDGDSLGVSHFLRMSSRLRSQNMSSLALTRTAQHLGGDVTIMGTREYIYFKSAVTRNCAAKMVHLLQEMTTKQTFASWEVADVQKDKDGMLLDLAIYQTRPHVRAVELLHSAAFRNTLGNSLYAADHMIGTYTRKQALEFTNANFSVGRMALIGIGVDEAELEQMALQFEPVASSGMADKVSAFHGGAEIRDHAGGAISYVAAGYAGPSLTSTDLLAAEVLRHILGTGPHIKYSTGTAVTGLAKAAAEATNAPFHVSGLNATYTDNGLFGFTAVAHSSEIEKVVNAAANQFKGLVSADISDEDVSRGKNKLKAEVCMQFENPDILLNWLGEQALSGGGVISPEDIYKMIEGITTNDVKMVAKSIASSKPSMASTGNTTNVPYLDKLFS